MSCEHCGEDHEQGTQVPTMRTFKVQQITNTVTLAYREVYVDAHSLTCEGDVAKFYTFREGPDGQLLGFCNRVVRPYLDIEDVTALVALGSKMTH